MPVPTSTPPAHYVFRPLDCQASAVDFGDGRAGIYFVCKSKDGKVFAGQVPLGEVKR